MDPLLLLDYPLNIDKILLEAEHAIKFAEAYTDSRYPGQSLEDWKIGHHSSPTIDNIMQDFGVKGKARFYWLEPFAEIPEHIDNGTLCSLNFILSKSPAPININGVNYKYKQALLNTTIPHSVTNNEHKRVMLKISIFDKSFSELYTDIPDAYRLK